VPDQEVERSRVAIPSQYVTSHSGQLSLLPSAGRELSSGQEAVAVLCDREGNRRSGVAPVVRHVTPRYIRLRA